MTPHRTHAMPNLKLDELERLAAQATPLPWEKDICAIDPVMGGDSLAFTTSEYDAAYITAACNAVPGLIAENRALRERVQELERQRLKLADLAIYGNGCFDCPLEDVCLYKEETVRDSEVCSRLLIEWVEQAAKEAGE